MAKVQIDMMLLMNASLTTKSDLVILLLSQLLFIPVSCQAQCVHKEPVTDFKSSWKPRDISFSSSISLSASCSSCARVSLKPTAAIVSTLAAFGLKPCPNNPRGSLLTQKIELLPANFTIYIHIYVERGKKSRESCNLAISWWCLKANSFSLISLQIDRSELCQITPAISNSSAPVHGLPVAPLDLLRLLLPLRQKVSHLNATPRLDTVLDIP